MQHPPFYLYFLFFKMKKQNGGRAGRRWFCRVDVPMCYICRFIDSNGVVTGSRLKEKSSQLVYCMYRDHGQGRALECQAVSLMASGGDCQGPGRWLRLSVTVVVDAVKSILE